MGELVDLPQREAPASPQMRLLSLQLVVAGLLITLRHKGVLSHDDLTEMLAMVENGSMLGIGELRKTLPLEFPTDAAAACRQVVGAMRKTLEIKA